MQVPWLLYFFDKKEKRSMSRRDGENSGDGAEYSPLQWGSPGPSSRVRMAFATLACNMVSRGGGRASEVAEASTCSCTWCIKLPMMDMPL